MCAYVCFQDDAPVTVFHDEKNAIEWVKDKVFTELYLKYEWEHEFFNMTDTEIIDEGANYDIYYLIMEYGDEEEHHCVGGGNCCKCKEEHEEDQAVRMPDEVLPENHNRFSFKKL